MATFEQLASDLEHAATPQARIAAAERLFELDDPRVVPVLARALADPSEQVRQRVEDLLTRFGRRDRTGNLAALLNEAERVAAALASEAERLRGGTPEAPEPAPVVEPLPPPDGYQGQCALVRLTGGLMDLKRVSRTVAAALAMPAFEVNRLIHTTKGFVARDVPADAARQLVADLADIGLPTGAVPSDTVPPTIRPARLRNPRFAADFMAGHLLPDGEESVAWPDVHLVLAGRVEMDIEPGALDEDWSPFTHPLSPRTDRRADQEPLYNYILELFTAAPARRIRLMAHDLDLTAMQRRPTSFGRVAHLAREIVRRVPRTAVSAGAWRLAERDSEDWDGLSFTSPIGYEHYATWHRLLLSLGVPLPR